MAPTVVHTPATHMPLPVDHPGVSDLAYRARRAAIAEAGERYRSGEPIPSVEYTEQEHALWRLVAGELQRKHERLACESARAGAAALALPLDRVPQLAEAACLPPPPGGPAWS